MVLACDGSAGLQSVLRSLRVLEAVSEKQPIGVNELARHCALPASTVQRILLTLADAGWIRPTGDVSTRWALTAKALVVGRRALGEVGLRELASVPMTRLRDHTHETINLVLLDGIDSSVMIERMDSDQAVRTYSRLGQAAPLHASATGRSMMAALSDEEIEGLISRGLVALTAHTITDPDELRADIRQIRRDGYAVNLAGNRPNVCSIGAAVLDASRRPVAAISISMPDSRFEPDRLPEWGEMAISTAHEIATALSATSLQSL